MKICEIEHINRYYHYKFEPGYVFTGHAHGDIELNLILSGSMNIIIGERLFRAEAGEIYLTAPWIFHHNRLVGESAEMVVLQLRGELLSSMIEKDWYARRFDSEERAIASMLVRAFDEIRPGILHGYETDNSSAKRGFECSEVGVGKRLLEVLLSILLNSDCNLDVQNPTSHNPRSSELCTEAVRIMRERISTRLTINELAARLHVCPTLLKSAFADFMGKGAMEYFTEMKIGEAKRLLELGKSIPYVSDRLGFSSQNYFSTVFKRVTGISPKNAANRS